MKKNMPERWWKINILEFVNQFKQFHVVNVKKQIFKTLAVLIAILSGCVRDKDIHEWCLSPGDSLPDFEVTTLDGVKVSSVDSYSAELVIIFFNTGCKDCRRELPVLQQQYEANLKLPQEEQKRYICISREEGAEDIEKYWSGNHLTLPVSAQNDRKIYSLFASIGIPRIFFAEDGLITNAIFPSD